MDATAVIAEDSTRLAEQCWAWLSEQVRLHQSLNQRPFSIALAGGNTPRLLYEIAGQPSHLKELDWQRVILLWGDERNVPQEHPDSNFRMVAESLLSRVQIPSENILAVPDPGGVPGLAATEYERLLYDRLGRTADGFPLIDCVLLGIGDDVHTASLFPESEGLDEMTRAVIANYVAKLNAWRITLTVPAINAASRVAFLISGSSKREALRTLWHGPCDGHRFPAQMIQPKSKSLFYFVDRAALGDIPTTISR